MSGPRCEVCNKAPWEGVNLFRQNAKGQPGIWRCTEHDKKADNELKAIVGVIREGGELPKTYVAGKDPLKADQ